MRLLFDQNLSPRLPRLLAEIFPESADVRELGRGTASDSEMWEFGKENGVAIFSKDSDFQARSLLYGPPPKFIWLRVGSCSVKRIDVVLRKHTIRILAFDQNQLQDHLMHP